jgi:hypothetical protein
MSYVGARAAAAINGIALVNTLLTEAGVPDRAYAPLQEFGGEGSYMMVLTPAMAATINASLLVPEQERLLAVDELQSWLQAP